MPYCSSKQFSCEALTEKYLNILKLHKRHNPNPSLKDFEHLLNKKIKAEFPKKPNDNHVYRLFAIMLAVIAGPYQTQPMAQFFNQTLLTHYYLLARKLNFPQTETKLNEKFPLISSESVPTYKDNAIAEMLALPPFLKREPQENLGFKYLSLTKRAGKHSIVVNRHNTFPMNSDASTLVVPVPNVVDKWLSYNPRTTTNLMKREVADWSRVLDQLAKGTLELATTSELKPAEPTPVPPATEYKREIQKENLTLGKSPKNKVAHASDTEEKLTWKQNPIWVAKQALSSSNNAPRRRLSSNAQATEATFEQVNRALHQQPQNNGLYCATDNVISPLAEATGDDSTPRAAGPFSRQALSSSSSEEGDFNQPTWVIHHHVV